jgi:hypothetical protein
VNRNNAKEETLMGQAYTELDAPTKWCAEARVAVIIEMQNGVMNGVTVNRQPEKRDPFDGSHCVGSVCAHWTWLQGQRGPDKKGFCGLSARPAP